MERIKDQINAEDLLRLSLPESLDAKRRIDRLIEDAYDSGMAAGQTINCTCHQYSERLTSGLDYHIDSPLLNE